ncbi:MAG: OsmC family protein [Halobacteriota archaeon]
MAQVVNGINVDRIRDTVRSIRRDPAKSKEIWKATTTWKEGSYVQTRIREFTMEGDEPDKLLGAGRAPNAVEALLHALGTCLTTSVVHHAAAKGITIDALDLDLVGELDMRGYLGLSGDVRPGYQNVTVCCRISADAPPDALKELWEHAQCISPVLDTVRNPVAVSLTLDGNWSAMH